MALIIKDETFTLSDSGLEIVGLTIAALPGSWKVKSPQLVEVKPQVRAYANVDKAFESSSNYLRVDGFPVNWDLEYEYGIDTVNFMYWLDLEIKDIITTTYPNIDEENITITTELEVAPIAEE